MDMVSGAATFQLPEGSATHFTEHVRVETMSLGTYCVAAGGVDDQQPHPEDEVYVVMSGSGHFEAGERRVPVEAGSVLFVPAGEVHRFIDVTSDLTVLVVFAPAYTGRASTSADPSGR